MHILKNTSTRKKRLDHDLEHKYRLDEIDHPNGWDLYELEIMKEMGFEFENSNNSTDLICNVESVNVREDIDDTVHEICCYKCDEGYVLIPEDNRRYVFENFISMIEFIESK